MDFRWFFMMNDDLLGSMANNYHMYFFVFSLVYLGVYNLLSYGIAGIVSWVPLAINGGQGPPEMGFLPSYLVSAESDPTCSC